MAYESESYSIFVSFPSGSREDRLAREEYFVGDIAEWVALRAKKYGDFILAKHMIIEWYFDERHNTAWLEHQGVDQETGEHFHLHHVACDCLRFAESDSGGGNITISCPLLQNALTERAHMIDRQYRLHATLSSVNSLELDDDQKEEVFHDLVLTAMEETLVEDRLHPDRWMANIVSGQHHVDLMGEILHIPPSAVQMYAGILELQGKVDVDGEILRLRDAA